MTRKSYNLALSVYSHIRHGDYIGAKYLLAELVETVNKILDEEKSNETKASTEAGNSRVHRR